MDMTCLTQKCVSYSLTDRLFKPTVIFSQTVKIKIPLKCVWWGNETAFVALTEGGDREKLKACWRKPANNQVSFTDSVTIATDSELELPLFVKRAGVTPLSQVWLSSLYEMENPEFLSFQGEQTQSFYWTCSVKRTPDVSYCTFIRPRLQPVMLLDSNCRQLYELPMTE